MWNRSSKKVVLGLFCDFYAINERINMAIIMRCINWAHQMRNHIRLESSSHSMILWWLLMRWKYISVYNDMKRYQNMIIYIMLL